MNKYKEALDEIKNIVLDKSGDGYHTAKYLQNFYYSSCETLQELVERATPKKLVATRHTRRCPSCNRQMSDINNAHPNMKFCPKWKMFNESKPLFSDLYLVKFKDGCFLGEYGVCYYSDEHKEFGEYISFYDSERDEDDEAFVSCKSIVAWAPFQRIDEEHKEKTAEQMFNDLDYKKHIEDGCIKFERHTENVDEALIEFDLDTKTVCASWFMEQKEITVAELRVINKQCEELNWL